LDHYELSKYKKGRFPFLQIVDKKAVPPFTHKNMPYEKIVLSGKSYISTKALCLLCENNQNLILVDKYGQPVSMLFPTIEIWTGLFMLLKFSL